MLLVGSIFIAARFGLVDLIAQGYRALAWLLLVVYVVPLLTSACGTSGDIPRRGPSPRRCPDSRMEISMSRSCSAAVVLATLLFVQPALATQLPADLDASVEKAMQSHGVPGIAIAIVEDGKPVLAKGYGVRKLGSPERVDADTIFPTGSTGKAVTTAALAVLVDQGKLGWDDKVIDHLPWFRMYDPWVTREMTVRDLLVHRSGLGLGAGDLLFVPRTKLSPRRIGAASALHQAGDQLPQRLRLRQPAVHGRRPADRRGQRPDLGSVRARTGPASRPA